MKYITLPAITLLILLFGSCELDNYDAPDAQLYGAIIDNETGDTIPQDLIEGSSIDYIELGFRNPQVQTLRFHVDGSYRNNLMFSGKYKIIPTRGNFFPPDTLLTNINKGENKIDFHVSPYCRIHDVRLELGESGNKLWLLAFFKLEQVADVKVKELMLAIDENPNVGLIINEKYFKRPMNKNVNPDEELLLYLDLSGIEEGKMYYVRVGGLMDIPQAKYNWCKAIRADPYSLPKH